MDLPELCSACKCGLCCFFNLEAPVIYVKPFFREVPEFISEHAGKVFRRNYLLYSVYRPKLNDDVLLLNSNDVKFNPCSFMDFNLDENSRVINELSCSIHESGYRPGICKSFPSVENRITCSCLMRSGVKSINVKGVPYSFNDDLTDLLEQKCL